MPRRSAYEVVLDASLFTPLQLQPVAVARLGFQAGTRWLRDHVCSHRALVNEHRVGLVLWSWQLEYDQPLRFEDADDVVVDVGAAVRGPRSTQLEVAMTVSGPAGVAVRSRAASLPLRLTGDAALSGSSARLPDTLVERFRQDERNRSPYLSPMPRLRRDLERTGRPLASGTARFRVHRHHCEVADQWYWPESLAFAAAAREELLVSGDRAVRELRRPLTEGIRRVDATWLRAGQLWDVLDVTTTGYQQAGDVVFLHELRLAADDGGAPCAVVVERS